MHAIIILCLSLRLSLSLSVVEKVPDYDGRLRDIVPKGGHHQTLENMLCLCICKCEAQEAVCSFCHSYTQEEAPTHSKGND